MKSHFNHTKLSELFKKYASPTPKNIKHLMDAVLAAAATAQTFPVLHEVKGLDVGILVAAIVAKLVSNLFVEDKI